MCVLRVGAYARMATPGLVVRLSHPYVMGARVTPEAPPARSARGNIVQTPATKHDTYSTSAAKRHVFKTGILEKPIKRRGDRDSTATAAVTLLISLFFPLQWQDKARNPSFTSERLRLHMDLSYYESPPGLQVSHRWSRNTKTTRNPASPDTYYCVDQHR